MTSQSFKKLKLPNQSGVYLFKRGSKVFYIGKATSLRDRVKSYFSNDLIKTRGLFLVDMVTLATTIDWQVTDSVLEAIILEAELIKKYQPKYNTKEKDDKSFNCVVITKEEFPRVLIVREKDLKLPAISYIPTGHLPKGDKLQAKFGPFPNGTELKVALKLIRKIFPFRDTCQPPYSDVLENTRIRRGGIQKRGRGCFNYQLGLCPGVCCGQISPKEYGKTIRHLKLFFQGKKKLLLKNLEKLMKESAKRREFESAQKYKKQLFALKHISDVSLLKANSYQLSANSSRLEAYDIAHISGTNTVGSMAVLIDGVPAKSEYRLFKIRSLKSGEVNDVKALEEILRRRLAHTEWPLPAAILVDGSLPQINLAKKVLAELGLKIPVVAVTKNERHRPNAIIGDENFIKQNEQAILLANAEAHRFALSFHRRKRGNFR